MARFQLYRGVRGILVADPTQGDGPARYAAVRKLPRPVDDKGLELPLPKARAELYEPTEQLYDITTPNARHTLEAAADKGELLRVGKPFEARDMRAAISALAARAASEAKKAKPVAASGGSA